MPKARPWNRICWDYSSVILISSRVDETPPVDLAITEPDDLDEDCRNMVGSRDMDWPISDGRISAKVEVLRI